MTLLCPLQIWHEETNLAERERLYIADFYQEMTPEDRQLMREHLRQVREAEQLWPLLIYLGMLIIPSMAVISSGRLQGAACVPLVV